MEHHEKPPTEKPNRLKKWIRTQFLSPYLKRISQDEKTLDLGCGYGFSFEINPSFYGIDLDEAGVKFCKQQGFNVTRASLLDPLPFSDGFFDNCFSHDVLEHFELHQVEAIFRNVSRILRRDGSFINVIPNRLGYDLGLMKDAGHRHLITTEEIREISLKTGFCFHKAYSSPLPAIFHHLFPHNKYVTICSKA